MVDILLFKDKVVWNEFIARSPQSNLFCTTPFLDAYGSNYDLIAVLDKQSIVLGAVIVKDDHGVPISFPFQYHGILVDITVWKYQTHKRTKKILEYVSYLLSWLKNNYSRISFSLHHSFEDLRSFLWFHFKEPDKGLFNLNIRYSALLDLNEICSFDKVIANVRSVRRQEYRRCLKNGYVIEDTSNVEVLDYLHKMTFERQGLKRSKGEEVLTTSLAKAAVEQGFGRILLCKSPDQEPASASLFLFDHKSAYYLIGANNPEHRNSGSGTVIILEQIQRSIEQGIKSIDFLGVNSPNRGDFKTSFNARLVQYVNVTWGG